MNCSLGVPQQPLLLLQLFPSPPKSPGFPEQPLERHWGVGEEQRKGQSWTRVPTDPWRQGWVQGVSEVGGMSQGRVGRDAQRRGLLNSVYRKSIPGRGHSRSQVQGHALGNIKMNTAICGSTAVRQMRTSSARPKGWTFS